MRLTTSLAGLALALASLTACGSENGSSSDRLDEDQLEQALLTTGDLPDGFEVEDDDDDDDAPGCLGDVEEIEDDEAASVERQFAFAEGGGLPLVFNGFKSYDDADQPEDALDTLVEQLEDCDEVSETDEDGVTFDLDITIDTDETADVDQQLTLEASGTLSAEGQEVPFAVTYRFARIDNNLVGVGFGHISGDTGAASQELLDAGVERLQAVVDGEDVPDPGPLLEGFGTGTA